ncbi:MAG: outer membrane beta-barrel protein [Chitinivibrionales bacterium]|nr:outer membrane beta-barrel protein [Chitinivibrionales bacterium]
MQRISVLLLILTVGLASAEDVTSAVGVNGGVNVSHFSGEDSELDNTSTDPRAAFNAGAFLEIGLNRMFSLQPEVQYTRKGETVKAGSDALNGTWHVELAYIEIPLLAKIYFPLSWDTRPFVYAGPFIGFNVNAQTDNIYEVGPLNFDSDTDLEEDVNPFEAGLSMGTGLRHDIEKLAILLDFRYTLGLSRTFDDETFDEVYNGVFSGQVGLGIQI